MVLAAGRVEKKKSPKNICANILNDKKMEKAVLDLAAAQLVKMQQRKYRQVARLEKI